VVLDRNRLHLTRFGDYDAEAAQTWETVVRYLSDPSDETFNCGIWFNAQLVGRVATGQGLAAVDARHHDVKMW